MNLMIIFNFSDSRLKQANNPELDVTPDSKDCPGIRYLGLYCSEYKKHLAVKGNYNEFSGRLQSW